MDHIRHMPLYVAMVPMNLMNFGFLRRVVPALRDGVYPIYHLPSERILSNSHRGTPLNRTKNQSTVTLQDIVLNIELRTTRIYQLE